MMLNKDKDRKTVKGEVENTQSKEAETPSSEKSTFHILAPDSSVEKLGVYGKAFDFAFSSDKVRNIALSGAYGSGKSSIMQSYENQHSDKKFIHISLARFEEKSIGEIVGDREADSHLDGVSAKNQPNAPQTKSDHSKESEHGNEVSSNQNIVNLLEGKILNQLLHQIDEKRIPESNFRIKREIHPARRGTYITSLVLFLLLCLYQVYFDIWVTMVTTVKNPLFKWLEFTSDSAARISGLFLTAFLGIVLLFHFAKKHNFHNFFKKVDVNGLVGIEVFEAANDSYFDKYLNEVLYLFDHSGADAIVFEDLDRYDVTRIFEKLREINELIYQKRKSKHSAKPGNKLQQLYRRIEEFCRGKFDIQVANTSEPLRFFYLIRDDVFLGSDRTKFFDLIIPVVPYIDNNNSGDMFTQQLKELGLGDHLTTAFLQEVSFHLSDMRLIKNIANEYMVYSSSLAGSKLSTDPQCQLAIIIYKNLFPEDFSLLQQGRGYVFQIFQQKNRLIEDEIAQKEEEIKELEASQKRATDEKLKNIKELQALFFPIGNGLIAINGNTIPTDTNRSDVIEKILQFQEESVSLLLPRNYSSTIDVKEAISQMESNDEYQERKKAIEDKQEENHDALERQINELKAEQARVQTKSLKMLLQGPVSDDFWNITLPDYERTGYVKEITQSVWFELLKYLLTNGYIDETFPAYLSYFYEESLSPQDRDYLMALEHGRQAQLDRPLSNCAEILRRMDPAKRALPVSYNYDLLAYILAHGETAVLKSWFDYMDQSRASVSFLIGFWETGRKLSSFISAVNKYKPHWFRQWNKDGKLNRGELNHRESDPDLARKYAVETLYFSETEDLTALNEDNWLTELISNDPEFLSVEASDREKLLAGFFTLRVHFREIDPEGADSALLEAVYQNNYYDLNGSNIKLFMNKYWGGLGDEEIEARSFTYLYQDPEQPLGKRVAGQMSDYVKEILKWETVHFADDEKAVIALLNHSQVQQDDKIAYLKCMSTEIESISEIENEGLWEQLLETGCAKYTWQNVADYYAAHYEEDSSLSEVLAKFIASHSEMLKLKYTVMEKRIGSEKAAALCYALAQDTTLPEERYRSVLRSTEFTYKDCEAEARTFPEDRLMELFKLKIIQMTAENVEFIRKQYPGYLADFIVSPQIKVFLNLYRAGEVKLGEKEVISILSKPRLDDSDAFVLLEIYNQLLPVAEKNYHEQVKVRIIENWLDPEDLPNMLNSFESERKAVQDTFLQYCLTHAELIYEASKKVHFIPDYLYVKYFELLPESAIEEMRPFLLNPNFDIVCTTNKSPTFEDTPINRAILDHFLDLGLISSYVAKDGKLRAYGKRKE